MVGKKSDHGVVRHLQDNHDSHKSFTVSTNSYPTDTVVRRVSVCMYIVEFCFTDISAIIFL